MTQDQALNLIFQALNIATQKGAFTIAEIETILEAYKALKHNESREATHQQPETQG